MTNEEARAILEEVKTIDDSMYQYNPAYLEALDMAIEALKAEPCEDAVSRQAALNALYALCDTGETFKDNPWRDNPHIDAVIETIEQLPPVTPKPRTGRWVEIGDEPYDTWECDNCGFVIDGSGCIDPDEYRDIYKYCPNCGAKMEGA